MLASRGIERIPAIGPIPRLMLINCILYAARDLGFSVAEISGLLNLWNNQPRQSADAKRLVQTHIDELDRRIQNMQHMAQTLKALIHCCAGDGEN